MVKSITVTEETKLKIIEKYQDYSIKPPQYASHAFKKSGLNIVIYNSMKVVFSGTFDEGEIDSYVDGKYYTLGIGSDEVGTGDFFGPIVVVSALIKNSDIEKLKKLRVADSKQFSDEKIITIAKQLVEFIDYKVVECNNVKYNDLYSKGYHIKQILALMHLKAISAFDYKGEVIVDQFVEKKVFEKYVNQSVNYTFETKAEGKYISVAVASIIARAYFIKSMNKLEGEINQLINKQYKIVYGAGAACDMYAKQVVEEIGFEKLEQFVKKNFKNFEKIKEI